MHIDLLTANHTPNWEAITKGLDGGQAPLPATYIAPSHANASASFMVA